MIFRPRSQPYPFGSSIANQTRDLTWVAMSTGMEGRMAQASKGGSTAVVPLYLVKAYYFASFCYFATYVRYATLYFEAEGFSASQIGCMIGVTKALTTLVTPLWNALADRTRRARTLQQVALLLSAAPFLTLAVPLREESLRFPLRAVAYWGFAVLGAPNSSMMDALARAACAQDADSWGKARMYGAVGWGLMHLLLGSLFDHLGFKIMFRSYLISGTLLFVVTRCGMPEACGKEQGKVYFHSVLGILVRNRVFFGNIVFLGSGFSMVENMLFLVLEEMQASTLLCGFSVFVTVIFELPIFAYAQPLLKRLGTRNMIILGQAAWVVRAVFYSRMSTPWTVLLIEPLHGVTFALVWTAATDHVASPAVCPEGLEASAQGLLRASFMGVGPLIGLCSAGLLFDTVGGHFAYFIFSILVLLSGLVYWLNGEPEAPRSHKGAQIVPSERAGEIRPNPVIFGGGHASECAGVLTTSKPPEGAS